MTDIMKDKELLMRAIDNYDLYTPSVALILKTLIELSVDDIAVVSILRLSKLTKVSRPIIYKAIQTFEESGIIERVRKPQHKTSCFYIKPNKLMYIIENYKRQENILNKAKI